MYVLDFCIKSKCFSCKVNGNGIGCNAFEKSKKGQEKIRIN